MYPIARTLRLAAAAALVVAPLATIPTVATAQGNAGRVSICHVTGNGSYNLITVNQNALDAHMRHGDSRPGEGGLDADCAPVEEPETIRVESPLLAFGPLGWGGWSCPAGTVAVGGGFEPANVAVQVSQLAGPGTSWPHYTFGPNETGWVVQNGNVGANLVVFVLCAEQ